MSHKKQGLRINHQDAIVGESKEPGLCQDFQGLSTGFLFTKEENRTSAQYHQALGNQNQNLDYPL